MALYGMFWVNICEQFWLCGYFTCVRLGLAKVRFWLYVQIQRAKVCKPFKGVECQRFQYF